MKRMWVVVVALIACGGTPVREPARDVAAPALVYLESLPDMNGNALPPRADAPRTVVVFFASW